MVLHLVTTSLAGFSCCCSPISFSGECGAHRSARWCSSLSSGQGFFLSYFAFHRMPSTTCLVTGGSGFLSTQIALLLLERGYRVRSTFRSEAKARAWIDKFPQHAEKFESVVVEDMSIAGAFDSAVRDVDIVFHTASPFNFSFKGEQKKNGEGRIKHLFTSVCIQTTRRRCSYLHEKAA